MHQDYSTLRGKGVGIESGKLPRLVVPGTDILFRIEPKTTFSITSVLSLHLFFAALNQVISVIY